MTSPGHNQIIVCPPPKQPSSSREDEGVIPTPRFFPYWTSLKEALQVSYISTNQKPQTHPALPPSSWTLSMHPG